MVDNDMDQWIRFCDSLKRLRSRVRSLAYRQVNSGEIREQAKELVQDYFRNAKPELEGLGVNVGSLDDLMQVLLDYANRRVLRSLYLELFKGIEEARRGIDVERVTRLGNAVAGRKDVVYIAQGVEALILDTLERLLPLSALSYRQVMLDLADPERVSFRGTAAEMREVFREVLDHLAPDTDVMSKPEFRLEQDCTRPTTKQKVLFILVSRGKPKGALRAPEDTASLIENILGSLARSTYERASLSTHVSFPREEVLQLKMYVDTMLCELLEIHHANAQGLKGIS